MEQKAYLHEFSTPDNEILSNKHSLSESDHELLILSIDLGDGVTEKIILHDNENPEAIINEFTTKNKLGPKAHQYLVQEIQKNLETLYAQQLEKTQACMKGFYNPKEKYNKGHELYLKGIKMKQKLESKVEVYKNQREETQMKEITFRPCTNSSQRRKKPPEQILLEKGRKTIENIEKKRFENEKKEMNECTFSPEVNKNTGNIKQTLIRSPQRFESLYQDAMFIQEKILRKSQQL
jgi:hypothetical protein